MSWKGSRSVQVRDVSYQMHRFAIKTCHNLRKKVVIKARPISFGAVLLLFFTLIYCTFYSNLTTNIMNTLVTYLYNTEVSPETLFIYRAYLLDSKTIRVLSINRCIDQSWKLQGVINGEELVFKDRPIEKRCPWGWAKGCLYNSYVFHAPLKETTSVRSITLSRNGISIRLPLHRPALITQGTLSICVPPIYWFTDWTKLIFFLEAWRAHGASHVFIYYHSSTQEVRRVLQHYEGEGFVTIISWSSLPRSSDVDPNRSLYRLGHSLAHNDCVLRISTEFGALVDIDELIVPRNGSLLSYLIQRFSSPSLGALCFTHRRLIFSPPLTDKYSTYKDLDFSGILTAKESKRNGPFKVPHTEAVLLHYRYPDGGGGESKAVHLFPSKLSAYEVREAMLTRMRTIFPNGAGFHFETQKRLHQCIHGWREKQNFCKVPISACQNALMPLEDWYFSEHSDDFHPL